MENPWKNISLADYENHMKLDSVMQLQAMNEMLKRQLSSYFVSSVMILGIAGGTLYTVTERAQLIAIYTINTEYNPEYLNAKWKYNREIACIIHRLCVSPEVQNRGIGKIVLNHIENQLQNMGFESVRLDVFSENPYAIRLYEKCGYVKRGYADWRKGCFWLMEKKLI